ncbi:hypothetical protein [Rhodopila sp.]|uniref:hypothetical protein n=1 Tax=Rhodopila sp. TaxID=2480087 RepID=UPI003D09609E
MKKLLLPVSLAIILTAMSPASANEQRDFPTGEPGATVAYFDVGGAGHPTGCVIAITSGLPVLGVSIALFSNNKFTITAASQQPIANIAAGSSATVKINTTYMFSKVSRAFTSGPFHVLELVPVEKTSIQVAHNAINQIVYNDVRVDVVADDAQITQGINIPAEPRLAAALEACQQYMVTHFKN